MNTAELLAKAVLTTADFGGVGQAPLSIEQAQAFIRLLSANQAILSDVRVVTSNASKWVESGIDFASRIARAGTEATRLDSADRVKPSTFPVEISTVLIRGEVPVGDETMEDTAATDLTSSLEETIASRFGFDIEDLMLNGDTTSADSYLAQLDGWAKLCQGANANVVAAASYGQDYEAIFNRLLTALPDRFKRNLETDGRFYVPQRLVEKYRAVLSSRGTPLGDLMLQGLAPLKYQGISIIGVPNMAISSSASTVLLTNRNNLYAGFRRRVNFETYRDAREGATSFLVNARVAPAVAVVNATAIATSVDVTV